MAQTYYGVFLPDGKGEPVALFKDGDLAQAHRLRLPNGTAGMVVETDGWDCREDIAAMFPEQAELPTTVTPDAMRKAEIKQKLSEEERDKRLTEEAKKELEEEAREAAKAKAESEHEHPPAHETELREPASSTATAPATANATTPKGRGA